MLSYAGVYLTLDNPEGQVQRWLDQWLPLDDLRMISEWPSATWNRDGGFPLPNYSRPTRVRLNTWYHPTGAARWSFGLFLATASQKNQILESLGSGNLSASLLMEAPEREDRFYLRDWEAYLLPPRPVSADPTDAESLWILPLVDVRYFWQFVKTGDFQVDSIGSDGRWASASWPEAIGEAIDALGVLWGIPGGLLSDVPSAYQKPDVLEFSPANAGHVSVPILIDALCHSVGRRFTSQEAGGFSAQAYSVASAFHEANLRTLASPRSFRSMSGRTAAIYPQAIKVVFRKWYNGIITPGAYYSKTITATDVGLPSNTLGPIRTISTSAFAKATITGAPSNQAECDALALQIAQDQYAYLGTMYDESLPGTHPWISTGFDDYLEFSAAVRVSVAPWDFDGEDRWHCHTRIHSVPHNFCVERMLHQLPDTPYFEDHLEGSLDGTLSAMGTATMNVFLGDNENPSGDSGFDVEVTDRHGYSGTSGTRLAVIKVNGIWLVISMACGPS